jgi:hypothetical protein
LLSAPQLPLAQSDGFVQAPPVGPGVTWLPSLQRWSVLQL